MGVDANPFLPGDPALARTLDELRAREPIFHRPELGTTQADFEARPPLTSGRSVPPAGSTTRETVWATLERWYGDPGYWSGDAWEAGDFLCRAISEDTYLLTYTLRQGERLTRRLTVWQRSPEGWRILHHQGTVVADDRPADDRPADDRPADDRPAGG